MPLANLDMSLDTYFTLVQRVNQLVQVTNEEQTKGFYSNGNVAVHGSITSNGNLRVSEANVSGNLQIGKAVTILNALGSNVALNVASGIIKGDGREISNVQTSKLSTNNFSVQSNNSTVTIGGSAELGKTLFLSVRTVTDLADNASGNVASAQLANVLDLHIKTVHGIQNTIVSTDLPAKQTVNTNLHQLANVGPMSNGDILVFANNRLERLPIGLANQSFVVANGRLEYANVLTTTVVEYFFSSGFWNKPANFKEATVYIIGGGGGGGGGGLVGATGDGSPGGGGGGGGVTVYYGNNATIADNVTVTVGVGGTGGNGNVLWSIASGGGGYIATLNYTGRAGTKGGNSAFGSIEAEGGGSGFTATSGGSRGHARNYTLDKRTFGSLSGLDQAAPSTIDTVAGNNTTLIAGGTSQTTFGVNNSEPSVATTTIYYGINLFNGVGTGPSVSLSPSKNGGNLVQGLDGVAYPYGYLFLALGGTAGYPQYKSVGANGGNGIFGSGGGGGSGVQGNSSNNQANTWGSIHMGNGGNGGNGYVVVISTIGRS